MSGMIERVARAICESERMNPDDALGGWVHWRGTARAAIEAMREPTPEMIELIEGMGCGCPCCYHTENKYGHMIDAALKEKTPK